MVIRIFFIFLGFLTHWSMYNLFFLLIISKALLDFEFLYFIAYNIEYTTVNIILIYTFSTLFYLYTPSTQNQLKKLRKK